MQDIEKNELLDKIIGQKILKTNATEDYVSILFPNDMVLVMSASDDIFCVGFSLENYKEVLENLKEIEGSFVASAEEKIVDLSTGAGCGIEADTDSITATFYSIRTIKGFCDFQFRGTSNGYYSERAQVYYGKLHHKKDGGYGRPDHILKELQRAFADQPKTTITRDEHNLMIDKCNQYFYNSLMMYKDELVESAWESIGDVLYQIGMDPHDEGARDYIRGVAMTSAKNIQIGFSNNNEKT